MTTTDHTPLAEQIAREHWLDAYDECGTCRVGDYAAHIATVTERAVRERVAAEIESLAAALKGDPDRDVLALALEDAARIARGATDD